MSLPNFSLAALRAYARIIETGSVTKAAQSLNISQSAVSHHLKMIEGGARVPLFVRTGQKLKPTEDGELLYIDVRDALDILANAARRLSPKPDTRFVLGVQYSFAYHAIAPLYTALRANFPTLIIELELLGEAPDAGRRQIDLCLSSWKLDGDFQTHSIPATPWRPYAKPGLVKNGLVKTGHLPPGDVQLISFEGGTDWRAWGVAADTISGPVCSCDSAGFALELAKQGAGVALCADFMAMHAVSEGQLEPLSLDTVLLEWGQLHFSVNSRSPQRGNADATILWLLQRFNTATDAEVKHRREMD